MAGRGLRISVSLPGTETVAKVLFYGSVLISVTIILMLTFHYTSFSLFSLDPTTGAIITLPINVSGTTAAYATSTIPPYVSTNIANVKQINYTVSFDVYISSSVNTGNMYRVLFCNGKQIRDPSKPACGLSPPDGTCDPSLGGYLTTDPADATKPQLLHVDANSITSIQAKLQANNSTICMYMDPSTNDLYLTYYIASSVRNTQNTIQTWIAGSSGSSGSTLVISPDCGSDGTVRIDDMKYNCESSVGNGWQTSKPIQNVPLQTPFRVTLAVDPNFIETYINGDLVLTSKTPAQSELYTYSTDYKSQINFMGPPMFSSGCKVGNIQYWNQVLPAKSIRLFSSKPAASSIFTQ